MYVAKSLMTVAVAIALSACSKSAPSESDARNVIQGLLGDCRYLSLDRFERVNGIPQGENGYQVAIKYTIKVTPVPENARIIGEMSGKLTEANERLEQAKHELQKFVGQMDAIEDKASKEYQELYKLAWHQEGPYKTVDKIEKERRGLVNSINPMANFSKECPALNRALYANVFSDEGANQFAESFSKEFSGTIPMVKTDKGWMAAN